MKKRFCPRMGFDLARGGAEQIERRENRALGGCEEPVLSARGSRGIREHA